MPRPTAVRLLAACAALLATGACASSPAEGCGGQGACSAGEACLDGVCRSTPECEDSAGCADGLACRAAACVRVACGNPGECDTFEDCLDEVCAFAGCRTDGECGAGRRCRAETRTCVECESAAECPAQRPFCRPAGACAECLTDDDCAPPKPGHCAAEGLCAECTSTAHCPPGLTCEARACVGRQAGQTCSETLLCGQDLICAAFSNGRSLCLSQCDVYRPACPAGSVCVRLGDGMGGLIFEAGRPVGVCYAQDPAGAGLGEPCGGTVGCQLELACVPESYGAGHCRALCDPGLDPAPCPEGTTCNHVDAGWGASDVLGICYVRTDWDKACGRDADCAAGLACTLAQDPRAIDGWGLRCLWSPPGASQGPNAPCASDAECLSGICAKDASGAGMFCYAACAGDGDCPGGFCADYQFEVDAGLAGIQTTTLPGCYALCQADAACAAFGSAVCLATRVNVGGRVQLRGQCGAAAGDGPPGARCASSADCRSGYCALRDGRGFPMQPGICSAMCAADVDCAGALACPTGGTAVVTGLGADGAPSTSDDLVAVASVCSGTACASDLDCPWPDGGACRLADSPASPLDALVLRCASPAGALPGTEPCAQDADCASGSCFDPGAGSICFAACDVDAQPPTCPAGFVCRAGALEDASASGRPQSFAACVP